MTTHDTRTEGASSTPPRSEAAAQPEPGYEQMSLSRKGPGQDGIKVRAWSNAWIYWVGGFVLLIVLAMVLS